VLAVLSSAYLLFSEALHLTQRSPYFLGDLGPRGALVALGFYGLFALVSAIIVGATLRSERKQAFALASLSYACVSFKALWLDAGVLAIPAVAIAFAVVTLIVVGGTALLVVRWRMPATFPLLVSAAHANACFGIAAGWALAGGRLWPFLRSPRTILVALLSAGLLLGAAVLQRVFERRQVWWSRIAVHAVVLASLAVAVSLSSRQMVRLEGHAPSESKQPDIYVLSFDALREDILREYIGGHPAGSLASLVGSASSFVNVVSHGSSTDFILANNTFAGSPQTRCAGSLPAQLAESGYFTGMLYAGVGRRFEGSVCYEYYFAGEGEDLAHRFTVPGLVDRLADPSRAIRRKVLRASPLLDKLAALAELESPLFVYSHVLELHAPYMPKARSHDPDYAVALQEYMQRCYTTACDAVENAELVARMRRAYNELMDEVDEAVARARKLAESRKRPFIIVLTADHGELFGEHGGFAHGGGFVPELLHIPFVVYDSRHLTPSRHCELMLSSEAMRATLLGTPYPDHATLDVTLPLGHMVIDKAAGTLRYEIAPDAIPHAGTWRNIHRDPAGTLPYPIERCD
jgi:hypothetical protein